MKGMFLDKNGKLSSKRILGMIMVLSGITGYFLKLDTGVTMTLITGGTALLGLGVAERSV